MVCPRAFVAGRESVRFLNDIPWRALSLRFYMEDVSICSALQHFVEFIECEHIQKNVATASLAEVLGHD